MTEDPLKDLADGAARDSSRNLRESPSSGPGEHRMPR